MGYLSSKQKFMDKLVERCKLKGFSPQTTRSYIFHVSSFLDYLDKSRLNLDEEGVKSNYHFV